jgi:S-adenosylmethionine synthetase
MLECFGTETIDVERLERAVRALFPLKPAGLITHLKLLLPVYERTAAYGHFGRPEFSWERTDLAAALKAEVGAKNGSAKVRRPAARAAASA